MADERALEELRALITTQNDAINRLQGQLTTLETERQNETNRVNQETQNLQQLVNTQAQQIQTLQNAAPAAAPTAVLPVVFSTNPFNSDINPTTTNGLKLFTSGTATRDSKLDATLKHSKSFLEAMRDDATAFGWGVLTASVTLLDDAGNLLNDANGNPVKKNILENFNELDVQKVCQFMNSIFHHRTNAALHSLTDKPNMFDIQPATNANDRAIFYKRVRANMIGMHIFDSLNEESKKTLRSKSAMWIWKSSAGETFYDGVTMLQILVTKVKPST